MGLLRKLGWLHLAPGLVLLRVLSADTFGQEASARAALSASRAILGDPVELQIEVTGARRAEAPQIAVEGLNVQYVGPSHSTQMRIENGRMTTSSTVIHQYQINAQRTGAFIIPAVDIDADGRRLRTQPLSLQIESPSGNRARSGDALQRLGFAEFTVPKTTVYLGETIPVELRLYTEAGARAQFEAIPIIEGEGFTKTKLTEPRQERARREGREYDVLVFRTAVTPSRAGKVVVGPSSMVFHAQIRQQAARTDRSRSLLEQMLGEDPFDPFFARTRVQRLTAQAQPVNLEVKQLPAADRPRNFSGAVGSFTLSAEGNPQRLKLGDVLTMKLRVSGRGNFDRVNAPEMSDETGWKVYPAKGEFKPEDELGMNGVKNFEVAVIPETVKSEMPRYEFAYFDPEAEKYVTLTAGGAPLQVAGQTTPPPLAPPAAARRDAMPAAAEPAAAAPQRQAADILGLRYDEGIRRSFRPLYATRNFWLAQLVPMTALLGWFAWRMRRTDAASARTAQLRKQKAELWRRLRRDSSPEDFLDAAAQLVKVETALATGCSEHAVDAAQARASRNLDPESAEVIDEIFSARAELLYAGAAPRGEALSSHDRTRILRVLETFGASNGRS